MIVKREPDKQKLVWMIKPFFENFFNFLFVLEKNLQRQERLFYTANRHSATINVDYLKVFGIQET